MTEFIWQLPNHRDARYGDARLRKRGERLDGDAPSFTLGVSDPRGRAFNYLDYLHQIARAAELTGFDGIYIANHPDGEESWIVAGYLGRATRKVRLITEFDAARGSAVYAAKNAASYQRFTNGRFDWRLSAVHDPRVRKANADQAEDEDLLPRIDEFLTVAKGVLREHPFSFRGRYFEVLDGGFEGPLGQQPVPQVYLSGDTPQALALSAAHADVHILDAQATSSLQRAIEVLREHSSHRPTPLRLSLRVDLLARESQEEAEFDAQRVASQLGESNPSGDDGLWPALGEPGVATLVGNYEQVAARLAAYVELGIDSFVLSASPHLEEAYRVGENVLSRVRALLQPGHDSNDASTPLLT